MSRTTLEAGSTLYRLDATVFAALASDPHARSAAAAAREALLDFADGDPGCVVHGEARLPHDATTGEMALATAVARLRERARLQRHSAERQVRDVLLQLLNERAARGRRAEVPNVAAHAIAVGRRLGLELTELDVLVRSCAEHYDGSGYPDGLAGEAIPLGARVIAVCAAFEAMTSPRPYRPALGVHEALAELCRCAGFQFDPSVVVAFCGVVAELLSPRQEVA